jgi:hypothetical protein
MRTLIFFREGLSGHYLKSLITDSQAEMTFRVDSWKPGIYNQRRVDNSNDSCVCMHAHLTDWQQLNQDFDVVLSIQVHKKIYQAIYNNFYKKYIVENPHLQQDFKNWKNNQLFWYDTTYYNTKEYYELYQQDLANNVFENVIDFDRILDIDYVDEILNKYYGKNVTKNTRRLVKTYSDLQLCYDLSRPDKNMKDIVADLPDCVFIESPWYASYCLFKFETNNNLTENQRQWSIDSIQEPIDKSTLLKIATQYQL